VLVIDDEPQVLAVMERVVRSAGFEVVTASDASSGLEAMRRESVDAIISDIHMPGTSGLDLLVEIRKLDIDVPVLFVTGMPTVETAVAAIQRGAFGYLTKPFDHGELKSQVRRAVQLGRLADIRRRAIEAQGLSEGVVADLAGTAARFEQALSSIRMAYQPLVRATGLEVYGYEALLRSSDPVLSHPGLVLAAAEQLDRLPELGRLIRRLVAADVAGLPAGSVFVNLHPRDLEDEDLYDPRAALSQLAGRVVLEITERASMEGGPELAARIARLRELGYRIAIDDLGAGYASLASFVAMEPDVVKVDLSLVRGIDSSPVKQRVVASLVGVCRDMGLLVVAEGVETAAERDVVVEIGCDLLQGFLFARPGPPFPEISR
jgi:EAL domain-containing protein (putative c-di-GMP-specific phosphodiesterase class I)